jgi:hypothetical protein
VELSIAALEFIVVVAPAPAPAPITIYHPGARSANFGGSRSVPARFPEEADYLACLKGIAPVAAK